MQTRFLFLFFLFFPFSAYAQNFPWERPLKYAWSSDGITFGTPSIYQDSSGVPSVVRWKGDTIISAFQWFRQPVNSVTWDRVAVKFSYDNGITWTQPVPIVVNGLPANYQRPFDPTLLVFNNDSIRIYFSSSDGMPGSGLDSTVNTYSAVGTDGINYYFDPNARVDELSNRVIDPALVHFNNAYHYLSPIGSPQQGAYHYISPDGINFSKVPDVPSDPIHNWTGNYMINDTNDLRFYGAGTAGIWFKSTPNGGIWNSYVNTNIQGGDPGVVKLDSASYLMVYVGEPYSTYLEDPQGLNFYVGPNPSSGKIMLHFKDAFTHHIIQVFDHSGKVIYEDLTSSGMLAEINLSGKPGGIYFLRVTDQHSSAVVRIVLH